MRGGSQSRTVIDCSDDTEFPQRSVAVHVIVVTPHGYGSDSGCPSLRTPLTTGAASHPSVAAGVSATTTAEQSPGSLHASMSRGALMDGGVRSTTVKVCTCVSSFPQSSLARQARVKT